MHSVELLHPALPELIDALLRRKRWSWQALERGDITMDTRLTASRNAARQPPSRLGLACSRRRGCDSITVEQAVNALVVQSANDVATLVAERLGGSEARFAANMTARARELGLEVVARVPFDPELGAAADAGCATDVAGAAGKAFEELAGRVAAWTPPPAEGDSW